MTISMYEASAPVFVAVLRNLDAILTKAEAYAAAKKIDPSVLVEYRLAADMLPLARQIQIATDNAKGPVARLAAVDRPAYEDNEKTFAELHARIAKTIAFIESVDPKKFDGADDREITMKLGDNDRKFRGEPYLLHFALPNFFFHVVTAYDILRHAGVEIGKLDFLGNYRTH
jgi:uncharacterized protein